MSAANGKLGFDKITLHFNSGPVVNDKGQVMCLISIGRGESQSLHMIQMDSKDPSLESTEFGFWLQEYDQAKEDVRESMIKGCFEASGVFYHSATMKMDPVSKKYTLNSYCHVALHNFIKCKSVGLGSATCQ